MKNLFIALLAGILCQFMATQSARATGFTDAYVLFYGEVHQVGGSGTLLLQSGQLEMTFVNQNNPANRVTLETKLRPTGSGSTKPYSYALRVPLAFLPEVHRMGDFLSIGAASTDFKIDEILIDGNPAVLPDGSKEFYGLSFASRASDYRLDLIVQGDSADRDGDGIPDWWEELYGLNADLADATADPDGDGWDNLDEFNRGSNPVVGNNSPQLVTSEIFVPELGEAGVYLHFFDSDTPADGINLTLSGSADEGIEIKLDGVLLAPSESISLSLSDLQAGRLTVKHTNRALETAVLPLSWNDGGTDEFTGQALVRIATPSSTDGNDAGLWLDAAGLGEAGAALGVWHDRSGNGRNASQPLASHQPLIGEDSVDFESSENAHLFFQDSVLPIGNHTVFTAYHGSAVSDVAQTLLSTNRGFLEFEPTTQAVSYPGASCYQMDDLAVCGYANNLGVDAVSIFRREGSLLKNSFGLAHDGENIASRAIEPVLPTIGGLREAIPSGPNPISQPFNGQIHEILVFPVALAEQKLRDVHDYLLSKWNGAIVWDLSTELKAIDLATSNATERQIIRGGHGNDWLQGGAFDDVISGGPGDDVLTGGAGADYFVFGGVDTGNDRITDFDPETDIIDLSAHFWGQSGDARDFISVRLDVNFSTSVPVLDSVLIVQLGGGATQEIVLENRVVGAPELIQLINEGSILMGSLGVPTLVNIVLDPGTTNATLSEFGDECFDIVLSRSGDGVDAALDVPLGFFEETLGGQFLVNGISTEERNRFVVTFARGETSRTLSICPLPDLNTDGQRALEVAVLPQYRFAVAGAPIERTVSDIPMVSLEVVQAHAVSGIGQSARVRIHREGDLSDDLLVHLGCGGTAEENIHVGSIAKSITIPAGQSLVEFEISPFDGAVLALGPKTVHLQLKPSEFYQIGNPYEGVLCVAATGAEASAALFDSWLQASANGTIARLADLADQPGAVINRYLQAYAFGLDSPEDFLNGAIEIDLVDGCPEILARGARPAADVSWSIEASDNLNEWNDASNAFTQVSDPVGMKFMGEEVLASDAGAQGPADEDPDQNVQFYRLKMNLETGSLTSDSIAAFTDAVRWGISGNANWSVNEIGGDLVSSGGDAGGINRIIAEVDGPLSLDFEMSVVEGSAEDSFVFYINGVEQARTGSEVVRVQEELSSEDANLLMWEFKRDTGNAVIRNLSL